MRTPCDDVVPACTVGERNDAIYLPIAAAISPVISELFESRLLPKRNKKTPSVLLSIHVCP